MVDAAAVAQLGCRTLCQHSGCGRPIELAQALLPGAAPFWRHLDGWGGEPHEVTPVEPEHPGEQLVARVASGVRLYQQGRDEGRRQALVEFAACLRERAGSGVDVTEAVLRWAAREAERRAGGAL